MEWAPTSQGTRGIVGVYGHSFGKRRTALQDGGSPEGPRASPEPWAAPAPARLAGTRRPRSLAPGLPLGQRGQLTVLIFVFLTGVNSERLLICSLLG